MAVIALVFVIGTLSGRYFLAGATGKDAVAFILMVLGAVSAIAPSFLAASSYD